MSNYYLCATFRHRVVLRDGMSVWGHCKYFGATVIMHDGIERPEDLCARYERKGYDDGE